MARFIGLAFVTTAIGCAAFAEAGSGASKQDIVRPKVELAGAAAYLNLPFQILKPIY